MPIKFNNEGCITNMVVKVRHCKQIIQDYFRLRKDLRIIVGKQKNIYVKIKTQLKLWISKVVIISIIQTTVVEVSWEKKNIISIYRIFDEKIYVKKF